MTVQSTAYDNLLLQFQIEETFYREADLLDARQYEDWLDMLTDDIRYFMPLTRNVKFDDWEHEQTNVATDTAWFDEGKETLRKRVQQIMTGVHWAEEPISRASHIVTNIRILNATPSVSEAQFVETKSRFLVYRNRAETDTDLFVGKREDKLRKVDGAWKISSRKLTLDQNVLLAKSLTVFF